ncbi:MAG TPA: adaptor protein MecA [Cerasibacillus sp.]|uniref:adaptor protein MecA n=1 Tax=Cerasibacillus sp. TaxID=2498711 RepID=UPI002F424841
MDIERINDHTIKFFVTYQDIEDRGFKREEIWYNRERSEQLFWQMMEEVNDHEKFDIEGPLWIQVQAMDKGLEVIVTKANMAKNNENLVSIEGLKNMDALEHNQVEKLLEEKFNEAEAETETEDDDVELGEDYFSMVARFKDFEDVIQLSHYVSDVTDPIINRLYAYKGQYYMYIEFLDEWVDDERKEDLISRMLEFATEADVTVHVLEEYGAEIFANNVFENVRYYFSA